MKFYSATLLISTVLLSLALTTQASDQGLDSFSEHSQQQIKSLAGALKQTLVASMQAGGPAAAVETCNLQAAAITAGINLDAELQIKRTSLKYRNPANQPDSWERDVLAKFSELAASGVAVSQLVHKEKTQKDGQTAYRLMRAIPVGPACLTCHGSDTEIPAMVSHHIQKYYPQDQATGYALGDIRGAFSVWQTID